MNRKIMCLLLVCAMLGRLSSNWLRWQCPETYLPPFWRG